MAKTVGLSLGGITSVVISNPFPDDGNCATYTITGVAKNIGGTVTVPVATVTEISDDLTVSGMSATADDGNNALIIRTQGKNATTIKWTAFVEWQELRFA